MALLRDLRLSGHVLDHAVDWDTRFRRWRVEVRFERRRIMWNWLASTQHVVEQRHAAEARRRRR